MNAKQALKKASEHIVELEDYNKRCSADIKAYNQCIDGMIAGKSPCPWCMEYPECQKDEKDAKGCGEWWLKDIDFTQETVNGGGGDAADTEGESERVQVDANTGTVTPSV